MRFFLACLLLSFPLLAACNSNTTGTIQIITDEEAGTFTQTPLPTEISVLAEEDGGPPTTLASAAYPTATLDLGNQDQDGVGTLLVEATDDAGTEVIYGASLEVQYGALGGETLPIFVQRVGQTARLPNPPADTRQSPLLGILSGRFLIAGGGQEAETSLTTQVYDFAEFDLVTPPPTFGIAPASMAIVDTTALLIDATGDAGYYDFSGSTSPYSISPPSNPGNFTFADVAGGQVLYDSNDGYFLIVGATRLPPLTATAAVLLINPNDSSNATYETGNLSFLTLSAPRLGAAAAWDYETQQLVVAGGNPTAGGVEVIDVSSGQTTGTQQPYPPDPTTGAGMTILDTETVLLAGGLTPAGTDAGIRLVDLGCGESCAVTSSGWGSGSLPIPITAASAFTFTTSSAFVVGSEPSTGQAPGLTHLFTLGSTGATEVPTRVPHTNAAAIVSPMNSSILVFGGAAGGQIESFTPAPQ